MYRTFQIQTQSPFQGLCPRAEACPVQATALQMTSRKILLQSSVASHGEGEGRSWRERLWEMESGRMLAIGVSRR